MRKLQVYILEPQLSKIQSLLHEDRRIPTKKQAVERIMQIIKRIKARRIYTLYNRIRIIICKKIQFIINLLLKLYGKIFFFYFQLKTIFQIVLIAIEIHFCYCLKKILLCSNGKKGVTQFVIIATSGAGREREGGKRHF